MRYCTAVTTETVTLSFVLQSERHWLWETAKDTLLTVVIGKQMQLQPGSWRPWYSPNFWITPTLPV